MEVILLKEIKGLGRAGDKKTVADGYAANYLLPQGLAIKANSQAARAFLLKLGHREKQQAKQLEQLTAVLPKVSGLLLEFRAKASASGTLFSGIGKKQIASVLEKRLNFPVKEKMVELSHDLKSLGEFSANLKAGKQTMPFKIKIIKENA